MKITVRKFIADYFLMEGLFSLFTEKKKKKIGFVLFWGRNMFGVVCCWNFPPLFLIGAFRSCNYSACPPPWIPSLVSVPTLLLTGMRGSFKNLKHFKRKKKKEKSFSFFFFSWMAGIDKNSNGSGCSIVLSYSTVVCCRFCVEMERKSCGIRVLRV
jgi:hypothetical protein